MDVGFFRRTCGRWLLVAHLIVLILGGLSACFPPFPPPAPAAPPASPWPTTPAPLPAVSPTPTPSPTVAPTIPPPEPAVISATIEAGWAQAAHLGIQPLCLRQEETDGDPDREWVGLTLLSGDPPRLQGFVLDGPHRYDLIAPETERVKSLGEFAACELEVRDINADGRAEIVVRGHTQKGSALLHVFVWDGQQYALLGQFEGRGGLYLENRDGDLADEIVVRWTPEGALVWEVIYTWDGAHYVWTRDRYAWFYLGRPHPYPDDTPAHALASFYLALNDRDLPAAYRLLSPAAWSAQPYEGWALGFTTTLRVEVGAIQIVRQEGDRATVTAQVRAWDNVDGRVVVTVYAVRWEMVRLEEGWRLDTGTAEPLEQWEAKYYP